MRKMAEKAGLSNDKKLTNHSARKSMIQKLVSKDIPPTHIMQISGHKNIQSLNQYSSITEEQHKEISHLISSTSTSKQSTASTTSSTDHTMSITPGCSYTQAHTLTHQSTNERSFLPQSDKSAYMHSIFSAPLHDCTITINFNTSSKEANYAKETQTLSLSQTATTSQR